MSFWTRLGLTITNVEMFKNMCEQHGVEYIANTNPQTQMQGGKLVATLKDSQGRYGQAYLVESGGGIKMLWDNDRNYNSLNRLGSNGGKLTRDYSAETIRSNVRASGGIITSYREESDGSIILKAAVGA